LGIIMLIILGGDVNTKILQAKFYLISLILIV